MGSTHPAKSSAWRCVVLNSMPSVENFFCIHFSVIRRGSCGMPPSCFAQLHQIQSLDDHVQHQVAHFHKHDYHHQIDIDGCDSSKWRVACHFLAVTVFRFATHAGLGHHRCRHSSRSYNSWHIFLATWQLNKFEANIILVGTCPTPPVPSLCNKDPSSSDKYCGTDS